MLRNMMESTVTFPETLCYVENGSLMQSEINGLERPAMIVFVDSTECSKCKIDKIIQYKSLCELAEESRIFDVFFLFATRKRDYLEIVEHLKMIQLPYPIYLDVNNVFMSDNPFIPLDDCFHTFFVDESLLIKLVGDPIRNESIMSIFKNIISNQ